MSGVSKATADRNQRILLDLLQRPGNEKCADCKGSNPRWASWNLGIFLCVTCAGVHRKMGTHISKVKSVTLDSWSKEMVENMKNIGNAASNAHYNPDEIRNKPPLDFEESERDSQLELWVRKKYQYKQFMNAPSSSSSASRTAAPPTASSRPSTSSSSYSRPPAVRQDSNLPDGRKDAALPSLPAGETPFASRQSMERAAAMGNVPADLKVAELILPPGPAPVPPQRASSVPIPGSHVPSFSISGATSTAGGMGAGSALSNYGMGGYRPGSSLMSVPELPRSASAMSMGHAPGSVVGLTNVTGRSGGVWDDLGTLQTPASGIAAAGPSSYGTSSFQSGLTPSYSMSALNPYASTMQAQSSAQHTNLVAPSPMGYNSTGSGFSLSPSPSLGLSSPYGTSPSPSLMQPSPTGFVGAANGTNPFYAASNPGLSASPAAFANSPSPSYGANYGLQPQPTGTNPFFQQQQQMQQMQQTQASQMGMYAQPTGLTGSNPFSALPTSTSSFASYPALAQQPMQTGFASSNPFGGQQPQQQQYGHQGQFVQQPQAQMGQQAFADLLPSSQQQQQMGGVQAGSNVGYQHGQWSRQFAEGRWPTL